MLKTFLKQKKCKKNLTFLSIETSGKVTSRKK